MKTKTLMLSILMVAVALPTMVLAGPRGPGGARGADRGAAEGQDGGRMEAHHAKMKARFAEVLRKDVGLQEDRAKQIEAIFARQHQGARATHEAMRSHHEALRALLESDSNDQAAYAKALEGIQKGREAMQQQRKAGLDEARKLLSPKEQAKLLRSMHEGRRKMMERGFGRGGHGKGHHGRGGPEGGPEGGPDGPDDDDEGPGA